MARKEKIVALWCVLFPCLLLLLGASAIAAPVRFETLDKGEISYYRYSDSFFLGAEMTIRDAATWSSFWKKHKSGIKPAPRPPKVDFSEDMVVVVMLGYQTSGGGPAIEIKSVDDLISISNAVTKNYWITVVANETPGPLDIITNPYHIIRVKKASSVIFEHEAVQEAVTYQITPESTYYEGCVSPCMCPVRIGGEIQGSFDLIETGADQWFKYYNMDQINWIVANTSGQVQHKITGKGSYKIGGDFALTHELILNLGIDSQPPAVFSSRLVPGGEEFPAIVITIDRGTACYDILMDIVAKPIEP